MTKAGTSSGSRRAAGKYFGTNVSEEDLRRRLEAPRVGCFVPGCRNDSHSAKMIGTFCSPCWGYLMRGEYAPESIGGSMTETALQWLSGLRGDLRRETKEARLAGDQS